MSHVSDTQNIDMEEIVVFGASVLLGAGSRSELHRVVLAEADRVCEEVVLVCCVGEVGVQHVGHLVVQVGGVRRRCVHWS